MLDLAAIQSSENGEGPLLSDLWVKILRKLPTSDVGPSNYGLLVSFRFPRGVALQTLKILVLDYSAGSNILDKEMCIRVIESCTSLVVCDARNREWGGQPCPRPLQKLAPTLRILRLYFPVTILDSAAQMAKNLAVLEIKSSERETAHVEMRHLSKLRAVAMHGLRATQDMNILGHLPHELRYLEVTFDYHLLGECDYNKLPDAIMALKALQHLVLRGVCLTTDSAKWAQLENHPSLKKLQVYFRLCYLESRCAAALLKLPQLSASSIYREYDPVTAVDMKATTIRYLQIELDSSIRLDLSEFINPALENLKIMLKGSASLSISGDRFAVAVSQASRLAHIEVQYDKPLPGLETGLGSVGFNITDLGEPFYRKVYRYGELIPQFNAIWKRDLPCQPGLNAEMITQEDTCLNIALTEDLPGIFDEASEAFPGSRHCDYSAYCAWMKDGLAPAEESWL